MMTKNKKKNRYRAPALNKDVLKKVSDNTQIIADIIRATGKSYPTVMMWLRKNSEQLTQAKVLNVICTSLSIGWTDAVYSEPIAKLDDDQN